MKIKDSYGEIINVFSIYWFLERGTYFYGLPKNYGGLLAYKAEEVVVVDNSINFNILYSENGRGNGLFHWALIQERLLDDIIELDTTAFNRFLNIIKSEGLVAPDFY